MKPGKTKKNFERKKMRLSRFAFLTLLAFTMVGCNPFAKQGQQEEQKAPPAPKVVVDTVKQKDIQLYITTIGETSASQGVEIPARVTGILEEIYFEPGAIVKEGDPLFKIQQNEYKVALDSAKAQLDVDIAALELAKSNAKRAEDLFKKSQTSSGGAISEQDYQTAIAEHAKAIAVVEKSKSAVERAEIDFAYTMIYAPITGKATWNKVDVGNLVGPSLTHQSFGSSQPTSVLLSIAQLDPIYVYFSISDADLNLIMLHLEQQGISNLKQFKDIHAAHNRQPYSLPGSDAENSLTELLDCDLQDVLQDVLAERLIQVKYSSQVGEDEAGIESSTVENAENESGPQDGFPASASGKLIELAGKKRPALPFSIVLHNTRSMSGETRKTLRGDITLIDNAVRTTTGMITFRGEIPNPNYTIFPGQTCSVSMPAQLVKDAVFVREEAILTDLDSKYVYIVGAGNKVERRTITLGAIEGNLRVVASGLKPGDTYVVQGIQFIAPGAVVDPKQIEGD